MTHNQMILLRHWSPCNKRLERFSEKVLRPKVQMLSKKILIMEQRWLSLFFQTTSFRESLHLSPMRMNKGRDRGRGRSSEPHLLGFHFSPVPWNSSFMLLLRPLWLHKTTWMHDSKLFICLPPTAVIPYFPSSVLILLQPSLYIAFFWSPFLSFSSISLAFLFSFYILTCFPLLSREEMVEGRLLGTYCKELIFL